KLARIRPLLRLILRLNESPHRVALAFATGAFIAFSPTYGLHTLSVVFCAWVFRLNVLALLGGSLINNPWTLVPILTLTMWTGFQILGSPQVETLYWQGLGIQTLYEQILSYALPFFIGGVALGMLGALVTYPAAYLVVTTFRSRRNRARAESGQLPPRLGLS
ncbi:MAG: DUF2062 domain-containing protein, partial [Nitrospiraceae bacterium]